MHISMINLNDFFDPKYASLGDEKQGIGATGILTTEQLAIRMTEPEIVPSTGESIPGLGAHNLEQEILIKKIYGYPSEARRYELRQQLYEDVFIRLVNSCAGCGVTINFPKLQCSITSKQLKALELFVKKIKEASKYNKVPISVHMGGESISSEWYEEEYESEKEVDLMAFMKKYNLKIDDSFTQTIKDKRILDDAPINADIDDAKKALRQIRDNIEASREKMGDKII